MTRIKAASYQFLYTGSMSDSPKLDFPFLSPKGHWTKNGKRSEVEIMEHPEPRKANGTKSCSKKVPKQVHYFFSSNPSDM